MTVASRRLQSGGAGCTAARSIREALLKAFRLVSEELGQLPWSDPPFREEQDCLSLKREFLRRKAQLVSSLGDSRESKKWEFGLKSCLRFFDLECSCDELAREEAINSWVRRQTAPIDSSPATPASWGEPVKELARRIRSIVGLDWAKDLDRYRQSAMVPDQNGCLEKSRRKGGTLSCNPSLPARFGYRVAAAKTKGRMRVVTLQSARVKRTLDPLHECLYDFISRRSWLVRGEFTKEHASRVCRDLRQGETIISGDYTAATDFINFEVVEAVVAVLSESPYLTLEERETLLGSFSAENQLATLPPSFGCRTVRLTRGQMMGSKLSFPMLCLINRAAWGMANSLRGKRAGKRERRSVIINGDDIAFAGDQSMFDDWINTTSLFGMVVNNEKTGRSTRWLELNSHAWDLSNGSMVPKPVFTPLLLDNTPGCVLTRLWEGLRCLSAKTLRLAVYLCAHEIKVTGVDVSGIPPRIRRVLFREKWFRSAVSRKPRVKSRGVKRCWPVVLRDFRPPHAYLPVYEELVQESLRFGVSLVIGRDAQPLENFKRRWPLPRAQRFCWLSVGSTFVWRWTVPVLLAWLRLDLPIDFLSSGNWEIDHPDLAIEVTVYRDYPIPSLLLPPPYCGELSDPPPWVDPPPVAHWECGRSRRLGTGLRTLPFRVRKGDYRIR